LSAAVPSDRERSGGPRSRKGAATRARLVKAAKAVFEEDGFLDARISDIAERAGLSHGSFYHYFDSKEQVFREVAMELATLLQGPLGTIIFEAGSTASAAERVRQGSREFLRSYQEEAAIIGVIELVCRYDQELNNARFQSQRAGHPRVMRTIRQMQLRGHVDTSLDPELAIPALGAMMNRFAEMWFVQKLFDYEFEEGVEQLTKLFLNALRMTDDAPRQAATDL
jgi:AcrR family transcriptional regulator